MKPAAFTPGPWLVDLDQKFTLGGDCVSIEAMTPDCEYVNREIANCMLDTDSHPNGPEWIEDAANCRLIASAPDLYAALETLAVALDPTTNPSKLNCRELADLGYRVLAKARGE